MGTKGGIDITTAFGFKIVYSQTTYRFYLRNAEDDEVGSGGTQKEAEELAAKLSKDKWDRWPVIHAGRLVTVTSFNHLDGKGWITDDTTRGRQQIDMSYTTLYPRTTENCQRVLQLEELKDQMRKIEGRIKQGTAYFAGKLTITDFETHIRESKGTGKEATG